MMMYKLCWHRKSHGFFVVRAGAGLLSIVFLTAIGYGQGLSAAKKSMLNLSDEEVIAALPSRDPEEAADGVQQVMKRGERMIPLLARCKGMKGFFYGYWLGHSRSSFSIPVPESDGVVNDGSYITVEVAAMYLISAIYYDTLEFAQAPYLTDGTPVQWDRFNTPERVGEAWTSLERWMDAYKSEGLASLRSKRHSPLSRSSVHFWGSR